MLMHPNKIKPGTLIDLGMHNCEMQGRALFSADLQNQRLFFNGRRRIKHVLLEKAMAYLHKSVFLISFLLMRLQ